MPLRLALVGDHVCQWLSYEDEPLGADLIRFKTEYASGKYGTTAAMLDSGTFGDQVLDKQLRIFIPNPNAKPQTISAENPEGFGTAATGVITEVGANVKGFKPGDRVTAIKSDIRQTNTVRPEHVRLLGDLDPLLAVCVEPASISFHCIRESNVRYGDTVAVVGLGALGLIAVKMAQQSGAEKIFAIDPLPGRRELAMRLGATHALDAKQGDVARTLHEILGGPGVDVAIELTGNYAGLNTALRCARLCGTVCAAGFYRGEANKLFLGREMHHNRLTIVIPHGCGGGHPPRDFPRWDDNRAIDAIYSQMRNGRLEIKEIVNLVVDQKEAVDVFRRMRDEADKFAKFAVKF